MKKLFFFFIPLLLIACKGAEKHRASIEQLSANWDNTTKAITDFKNTVSGELTKYTHAVAAMQPAAGEPLSKDMNQAAAMEAGQKAVTDALGAYGPFMQTINDFETTWNQKSAEVTALKDGLEKGKIEGDVEAKLTELNAMIATANENLASWKTAYEAIKGNVDAAMRSLHQTTTTAPVQ